MLIHAGRILVTVDIEPRDCWVGAYVDTEEIVVHICPLPMVHFRLDPDYALTRKLRTVVRQYRGRRAEGFRPRSYM